MSLGLDTGDLRVATARSSCAKAKGFAIVTMKAMVWGGMENGSDANGAAITRKPGVGLGVSWEIGVWRGGVVTLKDNVAIDCDKSGFSGDARTADIGVRTAATAIRRAANPKVGKSQRHG